MNSTEGYPAPRAIAAAIGRCGDAGYPPFGRNIANFAPLQAAEYRSVGNERAESAAESLLRPGLLLPRHAFQPEPVRKNIRRDVHEISEDGEENNELGRDKAACHRICEQEREYQE